MKRLFKYPNMLISIAFLSFCALTMAYISQYGFGLQPCILCLYQRVPFFLIILITIPFLTVANLKQYQKLALKICISLLLINAILALYHSGIEQKIFTGFTSCTHNLAIPETLEEIKIQLEQSKIVRCDKPAFLFLGLSMASWNVIFCSTLSVIGTLGLKKTPKNK